VAALIKLFIVWIPLHLKKSLLYIFLHALSFMSCRIMSAAAVWRINCHPTLSPHDIHGQRVGFMLVIDCTMAGGYGI
jgi:hypothetical protein